MNPNNITAEYYDIYTQPLKGISTTDEEISLINFLVEPKSNILDVGAGTGRHALILLNQGFNITCIESSKKMIQVLKEKIKLKNLANKKINLINNDIFNIDISSKRFDLVLLMWNSFNEICLKKVQVYKLFRKLKRSLKINGKILINIDDSTKINPSNFDFSTNYIFKDNTYDLVWKTFKYLKKTNTAISKEQIVIKSLYSNSIKTFQSYIKQRYWSYFEILSICKTLKLKTSLRKVKANNELYIIISN